jgi:DivIVA domain-containing protein
MGTALIYLLVLVVVAALFFAGASAVFGRGEELAPIPPGVTPTWLPDRDVHAVDVHGVRFQQAVRGYKMAEVDWVLDRLAAELERHNAESAGLRQRIVELESAVAGAKQADVMHLIGADPLVPEPDLPDPPGYTRTGPAERTGTGRPERERTAAGPAELGAAGAAKPAPPGSAERTPPGSAERAPGPAEPGGPPGPTGTDDRAHRADQYEPEPTSEPGSTGPTGPEANA